MDPDDYVPPRPLTVAIPKPQSIHGPCCPRKPSLREILANTSEPPWTLAAFMAYLSSNHCLETLEFTMDAGRYKKHYAKMMAKAGANGLPSAKERDYVQQLWVRLVEAYIQPSGTREVNIPSNVRDPILNMRADRLPPPPEALDPAVAKVYELMEESVLVPFLNSMYPQASSVMLTSPQLNRSEESISGLSRTTEARSSRERVNRYARDSPPPHSGRASSSHSSKFASTSRSAGRVPGSRISQTTSNPARSSAGYLGTTTSGSDVNMSGTGSGAGMTDDSGSTDSPANESPTTPPTSPPLSDTFLKRDSGMWKRLGRLSGMKTDKKRNDGGMREGQ